MKRCVSVPVLRTLSSELPGYKIRGRGLHPEAPSTASRFALKPRCNRAGLHELPDFRRSQRGLGHATLNVIPGVKVFASPFFEDLEGLIVILVELFARLNEAV